MPRSTLTVSSAVNGSSRVTDLGTFEGGDVSIDVLAPQPTFVRFDGQPCTPANGILVNGHRQFKWVGQSDLLLRMSVASANSAQVSLMLAIDEKKDEVLAQASKLVGFDFSTVGCRIPKSQLLVPTGGNLPAGTTLTGQKVDVTTAATTLAGYDFSGFFVTISAINCIVRDCWFNPTAYPIIPVGEETALRFVIGVSGGSFAEWCTWDGERYNTGSGAVDSSNDSIRMVQLDHSSNTLRFSRLKNTPVDAVSMNGGTCSNNWIGPGGYFMGKYREVSGVWDWHDGGHTDLLFIRRTLAPITVSGNFFDHRNPAKLIKRHYEGAPSTYQSSQNNCIRSMAVTGTAIDQLVTISNNVMVADVDSFNGYLVQDFHEGTGTNIGSRYENNWTQSARWLGVDGGVWHPQCETGSVFLGFHDMWTGKLSAAERGS